MSIAESRVSIVIPVRNGAEHVSPMLERLEAAFAAGAEVIVVDDRSTDDTRAVLDAHAALRPGLRVVEGPGRGVAAARNLAVGLATGEYVWFGDCDDDWEPDIVEAMAAVAQEEQADVVLCNAVKAFVGSDEPDGLIEDAPARDVISGPQAFVDLLEGRLQGHLWNKLFRRDLLGVDPFPPTRAHSDMGALLPLLASAGRVARLPRALYVYRIQAGSILNSRAYRWADLTDCLAIARSTAGELGMSDRDPALRMFTCTHVVIPLLNEAVRRRETTDPAVLREVRGTCRDQIAAGDVGLMAREGHRTAAAKLAVFRWAPVVYLWGYATYRRRRWGDLDRL